MGMVEGGKGDVFISNELGRPISWCQFISNITSTEKIIFVSHPPNISHGPSIDPIC